jgi:hypothetical protein
MRKVLAVVIAVSLLGIAPANATAVKAGAKCGKHKATTTVKGMRYTCIKSGNKLVWNKGVPVKKVAALKQGVCPAMAAADKDPGITQARANTLIGMSEMAAQECAMNLDWNFRLGQRDDEIFAGTFDYRIDRVTVTVMKGLVTQVNVG